MPGAESIIAGLVGGAKSSGPVSRTMDYAGNLVWPNLMPGIPELLWALRTGHISEHDLEIAIRSQGIPWSTPGTVPPQSLSPVLRVVSKLWQRVYDSQQLQPAPGELLQLLNRQALSMSLIGKALTEDQAHESLHRSGFADPDMRAMLLSLRNEIPGPSDLVRFALREAFNPVIVEKFGYNADFPDILTTWIGQQGYAYTVPGLRASPVDPVDKTWAHAYWWSHWDLPSPGQGYSMLQRLRPTGGPAGGPRDPSGQTFDAETLSLLLKAADYPSFWRDKLTAISYRVPGLRQISQLVDAGLVDRKELIEKWMDLGYNRDNSTLLSDLTLRRAAIRKHKAEISGIKGKVLSAYDLGIYTYENAALGLYKAGLEDPDQLAELGKLPLAQQSARALEEPGIVLTLQAADASRTTRLVKAAIAATRKAYLNGRKSADEARAQLTRLGIADVRIEEYMILWGLELDPERKSFTVAKVMHLFRLGLLPAISAKHRVERMGYSSDDAQLLLSEAEKDVAADQAKAQVLAARTLAQRQKALMALVKAQRSEHNRVRGELARHGTPAQLMRWYTLGYLDDAAALRRLKLLDWPLLDAETWLLEAQGKRRDYVAKKGKASQAPETSAPSSNGNGSPPGEPGTAVP